MCFVFEYMTGFLEMLMALVEDGNRLTELYLNIFQSFFHPKDLSTTFVTTIYSASTIDNEIEVLFFLNHDTRQPPR